MEKKLIEVTQNLPNIRLTLSQYMTKVINGRFGM